MTAYQLVAVGLETRLIMRPSCNTNCPRGINPDVRYFIRHILRDVVFLERGRRPAADEI